MTLATHRPPALDRLLDRAALRALLERHGRAAVLEVARRELDDWRCAAHSLPFDVSAFDCACTAALERSSAAHLRPLFNLSGTVLHTNLGRAVMATEAIEAVMAVMRGPSNLEFDLGNGRRGDRDDHIDGLLCELTGAEAATVVNNNAAAVLLVLAALAQRREVLVSRGELVEIGGAFRIPDIMRRANARLVEVGTTNRTHLSDFAEAITARTALAMKVHASNFAIQGFTAAVPMAELAALCRQSGLPLVEDLGSGSLIDMTRWGLPPEPTPRMSIASGANLVTFSGDKLLGGPQAGLIVGDRALVAKLKRHPLKRALRLDKMTIAALEATLKLYRDPDRLAQRLPTLRALTRTAAELHETALRLAAPIAAVLGDSARVEVLPCKSQIGSGTLPIERLESACIAISPPTRARRSGSFPERLAELARAWPIPVIGRIEQGRWLLDLRGLPPEDEAGFLMQWKSADFGTLR